MNELPGVAIPEALITTLRSTQALTILTGAGISAESGIPTFRDSQTGLWAKYDPHELATPEAFAQNPALVMDWYRWRRLLVANARPNPGHYALVEMEKHFASFTLITQNVDGLHRQAGSQNITELHGSLDQLRCSSASCMFTTRIWSNSGLMYCPECKSLLRPDIVWFGENLPARNLELAWRASQECQVFFSIGTSGVVEPAASLPYEALRAGATMVEINPNPTPLSVYSHYYFAEPAGNLLPRIVKAVWGIEM